MKLQGYVDADFAGDKDNKRSTISYVFTWVLKFLVGLFSCNYVILSITKAKYLEMIEANKELTCLDCLMAKLGIKHSVYALYSDNESVIHLAKNSTYMLGPII